MTEMQAIRVKEPGGPEQLELGSFPKPEPGDDELLVRVRATALNRADLLQREGKYPPPPGASPLLGLEMAGVVEATGAHSDGWAVGDRVCGLLPGGGYAEYAVVHKDQAMRIPGALSFEEAAAIPEVFLTAYQALYWHGGLGAGQHVLIHAGASGVGTAAIQLVRVAGAHPYVTASGPKLDVCRALGAEAAVDYRTEDFAPRIRAVTDGYGADLIIDFIGAPYFKQNIEVMATDGRLVILATLGGAQVEALNLRSLFSKRGQVITSTLRSRTEAYKARLVAAFAEQSLPLFADGRLKPVIDRVFDWEEVAEAHRYMGDNRNVGKLVLRVG